jgi:DNA repair exonuclease SbcCD ATPase subunit
MIIPIVMITVHTLQGASVNPVEIAIRSPSLSSEEVIFRLSQLVAEREKLTCDLQAKCSQIELLRSQLAKIQDLLADQAERQTEDTLREVQRALNELARKVAERQRHLDQINRQKADLEKELGRLKTTAQENEAEKKRLLDETLKIERQNADLRKRIEEEKAKALDRSTIRISGTSRLDQNATTRPVYFAIVEGRIAPLEEPYFKSETVLVQSNGVVRILRKVSKNSEGETIEHARSEKSVFANFIKKIDPEKQHVVISVDPLSFDAFRQIRQWLKQQRVRFGWDPDSPPFYFGSVGSPIPPIE